jgi:hypothetical protein
MLLSSTSNHQPIRGEVETTMQVENIVVLALKAAASVIEEVIGKK